jgi:hypothetical protein
VRGAADRRPFRERPSDQSTGHFNLGHIYGSQTVIRAISTDILDSRARVLVIQVATGGDGRATLIPETVVFGQNII